MFVNWAHLSNKVGFQSLQYRWLVVISNEICFKHPKTQRPRRDNGLYHSGISSVMNVTWDFLPVPWKDSICNINKMNCNQQDAQTETSISPRSLDREFIMFKYDGLYINYKQNSYDVISQMSRLLRHVDRQGRDSPLRTICKQLSLVSDKERVTLFSQ